MADFYWEGGWDVGERVLGGLLFSLWYLLWYSGCFHMRYTPGSNAVLLRFIKIYLM
jgi:hypothetical protein